MKNITDNFKTNLRYLLGVHNMTSADLAERLNISPPAISKWLNPNLDASPTLENLLLMSDLFGVSINTLLTDDIPNQIKATPKEQTIQERIDNAIMVLERIRADLKKTDDPSPPSNGFFSRGLFAQVCY